MWFKSTSKVINSEEFETLSKRMIDFNTRITQLELTQDDLRNKILRKIQTKQETIVPEVPVIKRAFGGKGG